jgi:hypothetical protein
VRIVLDTNVLVTGNLEEVRALLGLAWIDTTHAYTTFRPAQLKTAVAFYEDRAEFMLACPETQNGFQEHSNVPRTQVA